ncbi:hypothetical protein PUN28_017084 [Cardiocondyla obscurior]|uniref:Uncharacterized protein n=1 Tax=Cardiocondyla obscurior TaxID=286306 RepID=A0AAW2EK68_9HYME
MNIQYEIRPRLGPCAGYMSFPFCLVVPADRQRSNPPVSPPDLSPDDVLTALFSAMRGFPNASVQDRPERVFVGTVVH